MASDERKELVANLLKQEKYGVLSTISVKYDGWPFGSATPYALDENSDPVILVSALAEHTRNFVNDPKVCLFIQDSSHQGNPQSGARASILAEAQAIPDEEAGRTAERYLERFPDAEQNFKLGGFSLVKLKVQHVRYIGGFGEMFWI